MIPTSCTSSFCIQFTRHSLLPVTLHKLLPLLFINYFFSENCDSYLFLPYPVHAALFITYDPAQTTSISYPTQISLFPTVTITLHYQFKLDQVSWSKHSCESPFSTSFPMNQTIWPSNICLINFLFLLLQSVLPTNNNTSVCTCSQIHYPCSKLYP